MSTLDKHYKDNTVSIQIIDVIRSMPFDLGNVFKYMTRLNSKGQYNSDLSKIYYYSSSVLYSLYRYRDLYESAYADAVPWLNRFNSIFKANGYDLSFTTDLKSLLKDIIEQTKRLAYN